MRDAQLNINAIIKSRANCKRPMDSYPPISDFVPEGAAQVSGFQLYLSTASRQMWLVSGDFKKRGFVPVDKEAVLAKIKALAEKVT